MVVLRGQTTQLQVPVVQAALARICLPTQPRTRPRHHLPTNLTFRPQSLPLGTRHQNTTPDMSQLAPLHRSHSQPLLFVLLWSSNLHPIHPNLHRNLQCKRKRNLKLPTPSSRECERCILLSPQNPANSPSTREMSSRLSTVGIRTGGEVS